ncbi:MAG: FHA domain-containing protein [Myxococcaceae bacterium]|nr:FHA domain-containing protein [Myxococcaceae bacterium]
MSWLEVLATPPKAGLPAVGDCIALEGPGRTVLGGAHTGQIIVDVADSKRRHAAFVNKAGIDHVLDLASSNGTFVNGVPVRGEVALHHGDIVEIAFGLVFRYFAHEETPVRGPRLEASIGDAPHDHGRWQVYVDWLLERGDPLGHRMAVGADGGDDDARWLGPMARPWRAGNLELTWRHGFIHTATFRSLEWENSPDTYWCLNRLFELELSRFLEELHVDLFTTHLERERPRFEKRARLVLENLRHAPRTLKAVTLGPVVEFEWTADLDRELTRLREERPRLETTRDTLVKRFSQLVLRDQVGGAHIDVTGEARVHRFGSESVTVTLGEWGIAWLERTGDSRLSTPFLVNGRPLRQARLMHGDVVEPAPGARFVVEVS